jgi:hypothetical protein
MAPLTSNLVLLFMLLDRFDLMETAAAPFMFHLSVFRSCPTFLSLSDVVTFSLFYVSPFCFFCAFRPYGDCDRDHSRVSFVIEHCKL